MSQLRLAFSRSCKTSSPLSLSKKPKPAKCESLRADSLTLSPLARKVMLLQATSPRAATVIEKLVDDALRRRAG